MDDMPLPDPFVTKVALGLSPPSGADNLADLERVLRGLEHAGLEGVRVPLSVISGIPETLRSSGFRVTATVGFSPYPVLLRLEPSVAASKNIGLAVDLGSTNIVAALLDLDTGETLARLSALNPQVAHGDDILSRTHFCIVPGNIARLQSMAADCISGLADDLAASSGCSAADISCVSVAGNTTMAHLLLGLDPYHICRAPYVPAANRFPVVTARELGLRVNPEALVYVLPNVGSYVGGDAIAGVLVSGMHRREGISLLVDIGTNAEIIVGNREFLFAGAGSAGPGLEGAVVRQGMRAVPGAIERVTIDPESFEPAYTVIGGIRPSGICGSALIDVMAELFTTGLIDRKGRFAHQVSTPRMRAKDGVAEYVLAYAGETSHGRDIAVSQTDIENLMMGKAAMYTMLSVVASSVGVGFGELERFYMAGAFGAYIASGKAMTIGMLPEIPGSRYETLGNSSLEGTARVLLSRTAMDEAEEIARMMTYMEMNESTEFMNLYMAAMFLPHTDGSLFPGSRFGPLRPARGGKSTPPA